MHIPQQQRAELSSLQSLHPAPAASGASAEDASSGSSSNTSEASITANDFLTLLVSEMKNQDPTSNQDPNEYIDQLVQVNSLEQLIQINTDLGGSSSSSGTSSSDAASGTAAAASQQTIHGNLSAHDTGASAGRVATALSAHVPGATGEAASGSADRSSLPSSSSASDLRAYILQRLHQQ
ncbi:flagellar hook capping FlgD N-terminal domain-containing protein [Paracidobacterium acidisoli]|uniref:Basal-body rod modification protein FlgD n=1 Tax=Paracidobacterium acidisoli TaxID=2303751 RepID=A0A372IR93_9BACT|nr:flagellar hook capping FlgD N-terminal domain-containing protein [Paracidobacterium acidisoli]MBT9330295.1 hypothetical protein [Paracidobacterium acidisoli]